MSLFIGAEMQDWFYWDYFSHIGEYGAAPSLYYADAEYYFTWYEYVTYDEVDRKCLLTQMLVGDPTITPVTAQISEPLFGIFPKGEDIELSGTGFAPDAQLNIYLRGFYLESFFQRLEAQWGHEVDVFEYYLIGSTTTDGYGNFGDTFTLPLNIPWGMSDIFVADENGNMAFGGWILVPPHTYATATPDRGIGQFTIELECFDFAPYSYLHISIDRVRLTELRLFTDTAGLLKTSFVMPITEPGIHILTISDPFGISYSTPLTVIDDTPLDIDVDVGPIHFRGETGVTFYALIRFKGEPTNATDISATLYKPDGTTESLTVELINTGFYKISYDVPIDAPSGEYTLVIWADYITNEEAIESSGASLKSFEVDETLEGWNAWLGEIHGDVAIIRTEVGEIEVKLDDLNPRITNIEGNIATIQTDIGTINGRVTSIEGGVATIQTDVGTLRMDVSHIKTDTQTAASRSAYLLPILIIAGVGIAAAVTAAIVVVIRRL